MSDTLSVADVDFVRRFVHDRGAIVLDETKGYLIEARLSPIARREAMTLTHLVSRLRRGSPTLEQDVVEALATNETTFFRDVKPFDALRDVVLPDVLTSNDGRQLAIWSAAASTGQEAYSLAMIAAAHFPPRPRPDDPRH